MSVVTGPTDHSAESRRRRRRNQTPSAYGHPLHVATYNLVFIRCVMSMSRKNREQQTWCAERGSQVLVDV